MKQEYKPILNNCQAEALKAIKEQQGINTYELRAKIKLYSSARISELIVKGALIDKSYLSVYADGELHNNVAHYYFKGWKKTNIQ